MGIFDRFKKKDDFEKSIKDPLSDPLSKMPQDTPAPGAQQAPADIPPLEMPGMPSQNDPTLEGFGSSMNQTNTQTSAAPIPSLPRIGEDMGIDGPQEQGVPAAPLDTQPQTQTPQHGNHDRRDMDLISSKLDNIKSLLENISQRVANLEKKAVEEEAPRPKRFNW